MKEHDQTKNHRPTVADDPKPQHLNMASHALGKRGVSRKWLIVAAIALVLAGGGMTAYFVLGNSTGTTEQSATTDPQPEQGVEEQEPTLSPAEAAKPVTYKSEVLNIELTHRADWSLTETEDKQLILTSPKSTQSGQSEVFTLKIGLGISDNALKGLNAGKAVKSSELIGYSEPTEAQRHYTNVTYAGQEGQFRFFIVTGSSELKTGQNLEDVIFINNSDFLIVGGYGADPQDGLAFTPVDAARFDSLGMFKQAIQIVESLKIY